MYICIYTRIAFAGIGTYNSLKMSFEIVCPRINERFQEYMQVFSL